MLVCSAEEEEGEDGEDPPSPIVLLLPQIVTAEGQEMTSEKQAPWLSAMPPSAGRAMPAPLVLP